MKWNASLNRSPMPLSRNDRALARAVGRAQRLAPEVAKLVAESEELPLDVRIQAVAVQEEFDLLRHCLRLATLQQAINEPKR